MGDGEHVVPNSALEGLALTLGIQHFVDGGLGHLEGEGGVASDLLGEGQGFSIQGVAGHDPVDQPGGLGGAGIDVIPP